MTEPERVRATGSLRLSWAILLLLLMPSAFAAAGVPEPAPTPEVAAFYTRPLIKARLRVPQSLQDYRIATITPSRDDPARFDIEVHFKARTPFGARTEHSARFQMKRAASAADWIVTAQ